MDPATFHSLECRLEDATFASDKLSVLNSSQGYFNGHQLARVVETFLHDNDKLKAVQAIQGRLYPMTCAEAAQVLEKSPFSSTQLKILEIVARNITDVTTGGHLVQEAFSFGHDKKKAMEILNRCSGAGGGYPAGAPVGYPSAPPTTRPAASGIHIRGPDLGGMLKGMGAAMGAAMGATVQGANAMAQAMGAGFDRGKVAPGAPPPSTGTHPGTYPGQTNTAYAGQTSTAYPGQTNTAYPGQTPPGPGYPPAPGTGYPPAPGTGYPPAPGTGYPSARGLATLLPRGPAILPREVRAIPPPQGLGTPSLDRVTPISSTLAMYHHVQ
ncbi:uncharacterized protein LOC144917181 [Branchiostoma floridae x Branchiostoma belcheri]